MRAGEACRRLVGAIALSLGLAATAAPVAAAADSVSIGVPPDVAYGLATEITVSGESAQGTTLSVWLGGECWKEPQGSSSEPVEWLAQQAPLPGGAFERRLPFTQSHGSPGSTICARVHRTPGVWHHEDVYAEAEVDPLTAPGDVTIALTGPLQRTVPTTIVVSGTTAVPRRLRVGTTSTGECGDSMETSFPPRGAWQQITPDEGISLSAGPFSHVLAYTPLSFLPTKGLCAFLEAPGWFERSIVMHLPVTVGPEPVVPEAPPRPPARPAPPPARPTPRVTVLSPLDGASARMLNPTFTWNGPAGRRPAAYTLRLAHLEGAERTPLLTVTRKRYRLPDAELGERLLGVEEPSGPVSSVADAGRDGANDTLRLHHGLAPGTYEWTIDRADLPASAPHRFTVEAAPLERLQASARRTLGRYSFEATGVAFQLRAAPFASLELTTTGGGRTEVERWRLGRSGHDRWTVTWSCRHPGARFRWTLVARDAYDRSIARSGRFALAPRSYCAALVRRERAAERRRAARERAEERRRAARELARRLAEARRQAAELERFRRNCRAIGGAPVEIEQSDGSRTLVCRAPRGGTLAVPGF